MFGSRKRRQYTFDEVLDELKHSDEDSGDDHEELLTEEEFRDSSADDEIELEAGGEVAGNGGLGFRR